MQVGSGKIVGEVTKEWREGEGAKKEAFAGLACEGLGGQSRVFRFPGATNWILDYRAEGGGGGGAWSGVACGPP